jgi:ANTAR domain
MCKIVPMAPGTLGYITVMAKPEADHGGVLSREQQEAVSRAVALIMENRAVISQASGILMMVYDMDAEAAFAVLKKRSQDTNTKLRALAAQLLLDVQKLDHRAQPYGSRTFVREHLAGSPTPIDEAWFCGLSRG